MSSIPPDILAWRKRTGADQWDEMWEGVLHIGPSPNRDHQDLQWALETYLRLRWAKPLGGRVIHDINLASKGGWPRDYRIPDLVLIRPERFEIDFNEYLEGAPDGVVEIRSPDDETEEKLPFYARLGVPEVWVIDRDSKEPSIHVLRGGRYESQAADAGGWKPSKLTRIELRRGRPGKLEARSGGDDATLEELP